MFVASAPPWLLLPVCKHTHTHTSRAHHAHTTHHTRIRTSHTSTRTHITRTHIRTHITRTRIHTHHTHTHTHTHTHGIACASRSTGMKYRACQQTLEMCCWPVEMEKHARNMRKLTHAGASRRCTPRPRTRSARSQSRFRRCRCPLRRSGAAAAAAAAGDLEQAFARLGWHVLDLQSVDWKEEP